MFTLHLFTISFLLTSTRATLHPAKRLPQPNSSPLSIQDICGPDATDCGSGWCCGTGTKCIPPSSPSDTYQCVDNLFPTLTLPAIDYSSFASLVNLDPLTSLGLTLSTFPTTLTSGATLRSYSDNVLSTTTSTAKTTTARTTSKAGTGPSKVGVTAAASSSTGGAVGRRLGTLVVVGGGIVGVGVLVGV